MYKKYCSIGRIIKILSKDAVSVDFAQLKSWKAHLDRSLRIKELVRFLYFRNRKCSDPGELLVVEESETLPIVLEEGTSSTVVSIGVVSLLSIKFERYLSF